MLGAQAPVPRLRRAAPEAQTPVADGAALEAQAPVSWLRGAALEVQAPVVGMPPGNFVTGGEGAVGSSQKPVWLCRRVDWIYGTTCGADTQQARQRSRLVGAGRSTSL